MPSGGNARIIEADGTPRVPDDETSA
jgi:hypothetical protein